MDKSRELETLSVVGRVRRRGIGNGLLTGRLLFVVMKLFWN
jgi:hypothetical protein